MKKMFYNLCGLFGMIVMFSTDLSARSFLSKVSSVVIIFTILSGAAIWVLAAKKRKDLE